MLIVQKYGGSSLADVRRIQQAAARVAGLAMQGCNMVVVVFSGNDMHHYLGTGFLAGSLGQGADGRGGHAVAADNAGYILLLQHQTESHQVTTGGGGHAQLGFFRLADKRRYGCEQIFANGFGELVHSDVNLLETSAAVKYASRVQQNGAGELPAPFESQSVQLNQKLSVGAIAPSAGAAVSAAGASAGAGAGSCSAGSSSAGVSSGMISSP